MKLLRRLLGGSAKPLPTARVPDDTRVYAIGDIHGRSDLLGRMADLIAADLTQEPVGQAIAVFLGDYVDRGPNSRGVLDRLAAADFPVPATYLLGNHETMLLRFLMDPETGVSWRQYGGLETLHSYGLDVRELRAGRGLPELAAAFAEVLPAPHLELIRRAHLSYAAGDYFFCHAGVRPGVPLDQQQEHDLLWIRDPFLASDANFGKVVVHGHSPVMEPETRPNRINIDTGAYVSGRLTALVLEGADRRFLSTGG